MTGRNLTALILAAAAMALLFSCAPEQTAQTDAAATPEPPAVAMFSMGEPKQAEPADSAVPEPTATPGPVRVTLGAVGDVMAMRLQIAAAFDEASGTYDFSPSFTGMETLFRSADLMCANLETPLAGEEAGYSKKQGSAETPTFNAPDALAEALQAAGVDVLTIANNHCLDRDLDGLIRTVETLDRLGIWNTGGYRSEEDRAEPCVVSVRGVRIGILAASYGFNGRDHALDAATRLALLSDLDAPEQLQADIAACRAAGAEFIVCFPHWDRELTEKTADRTRETARWLLENGVDLILGAHPHVVQGFEWMEVDRGGIPYRGLVVYSLGNCVANMAQETTDYGLFVRVTLVKEPDGTVSLSEAGYLPTMYFTRRVGEDQRTLHQVVPAWESGYADPRLQNVPEDFAARCARARAHVTRVCGEDVIPLLPDSAFIP